MITICFCVLCLLQTLIHSFTLTIREFSHLIHLFLGQTCEVSAPSEKNKNKIWLSIIYCYYYYLFIYFIGTVKPSECGTVNPAARQRWAKEIEVGAKAFHLRLR